MNEGSFWSVMIYVAWRNLRVLFRNPALLFPAIMLPVFFLIAFTGSLSAVDQVGDFGTPDYTGFQYVFALMQAAAFTGAMGGFAIAEDWEGGFMRRIFIASKSRVAIVVGYALAMIVRGLIPALILTGVAIGLGMGVDGDVLDLIGLYSLVLLLGLAALFWSAGLAMRARSFKAAQAMVLPIFLLLFIAPVFVPLDLLTGWLHAVAVVNPMTYLLEAGRGFLGGNPTDTGLAFLCAGGMAAVFAVWAFSGVRSAEAYAG